MTNITGVVITKNEEKAVSKCLESLKFCDEVIVIDDNSQDETVRVAKASGAEVFVRDSRGDFAGQRNYALSIARGNWVLFVDAD